MMSPDVYEKARATAPIHVQLRQIGVPSLGAHEASVLVQGRIVRIFRDRERQLHWGQRVTFHVAVTNRGASGPPVLSGELFHDASSIRQARWLEAFLECWDGKIDLVRSQVITIRYPTLRPVCRPDAKGYLP